jgi:uncharacterized protein (DUF4415 family)
MINPLPLTDENGEVRELTEQDFKNAVPFSALPASLQETLRGIQRKKPAKVSTTVRFDREVIDAFRATGKGWQTRMNQALKDWLKTHPATG